MAAAAGVQVAAPSAQALPPEFLANIALNPTNPQAFAVRWDSAGGGILFTQDGGKSFQMHPAHVFYGYDMRGYTPMLIGGDGKLMIAMVDGLYVDDGTGCNITSDPAVDGKWIAALASDPADPNVSYVVTTGNTGDVHAGLWKRDQTGAMTAFGSNEPLSGTTGIRFSGLAVLKDESAMGGLRFLETGTRYPEGSATPTPSPVFRTSVDMGETWDEQAIPDPDMTEGVPRIILTDPADPMKMLVSLEVTKGDQDPNDPILYSVDGGKTFMPFTSDIQAPSQALLLPSGQILVGDSGAMGGGLYSSMGFDQAPTKILDLSVNCLGQEAQSGTIYMCKQYEIGMYDPAANTFCGMFQLNEVTDFVSCAGQDLVAKAEDQLCNAWCGGAHYPLTRVCSHYDNSSGLCGVKACMFDVQDPDPSKHWIEPPGNQAAARCPSFPQPTLTCGGTTGGTTAGGGGTTGGATTGGTTGGATAGTTSGGSTAGGTTAGVATTGGTAVGSTAGGATPGGTAGGTSSGNDGTKGSCQLSATREGGAGLLGGFFGLALFAFVRRRVFARRSA